MSCSRAIVLFVLLGASSSSAQTIRYIAGFETGDGSEVATLGGTASVVTSPVTTGKYALSVPPASDSILKTGLSATQTGVRFSYQITSIGVLDGISTIDDGTSTQMFLNLTTGGQLSVTGTLCTMVNSTGSTVLSTSTAYTIRYVFDTAAGGVAKVWLDDSLEINTTHTAACVNNTTRVWAAAPGTAGGTATFDDVLIQTGSTAQPPKGQLIARQGKTGTPTYTGGTNTCSSCTSTNCSGSCATGTACCALSETPFGTAKNTLVPTAASQTMLVCAFSDSSCPNAGTQVLGASDTINDCKTAAVAKRAAGSAPANCTGGTSPHCLLTRLNGSDTVTSFSPGTSDAYVESAFFTTANANLDTAEIGGRKGTGTGRDLTIEDMWLMCDYTPAAGGTTTTSSTSTSTSTSLPPPGRALIGVGRPSSAFDDWRPE